MRKSASSGMEQRERMAQVKGRMAELEKVVREEARKEIMVMRAAREYFKDDKLADAATKNHPASSNQDCMKDVLLSLMSKWVEPGSEISVRTMPGIRLRTIRGRSFPVLPNPPVR